MNNIQSWLDDVAAYERTFKQWEGRVEKIIQRYRDESRNGQKTWTSSKFNILWSNVQTLSSATFSRLPKPEVTRSFRDSDPVGRVASLLLERGLDYHVQHYPQYRMALKADVLDRFLSARGTAWVRYEPHMKSAQKGEPVDGDQITDDIDTPDEELDYECVAVDYVHYKDFGHSVARTWEEVDRVWRKVYMTREALVARFGDEGKKIPLDADPKEFKNNNDSQKQDAESRATIYEGWEKSTRKAYWFSKTVKDFLDEKDDPLGLEDVFPCPKPLYGTLTNDSLVPVPDFIIYQDQANELDILADRIDGLIKALKVSGGYDASIPELARIFKEGENRTLIPIKNWAAFAEKNGLQGSLSLVDLKPIADALKTAYEAFMQVKNQVDELLGISDIMRGQTEANETATAQNLKAQYGSLKLKSYQNEVSQFAADLFKLMAQVICNKFNPQTIATISGAQQLLPQDQPLVPQALALLIGPERMADPEAPPGPNPVRNFRIEVASDSLIYLDEEQEKKSRVEFLGAVGTYLQNVAKAMQGVPQPVAAVLIPLLMDMLKFGVTGYRVGKVVEGAFDQAAEALKQIAAQPPQPQEAPEVQAEKIRAQTEMQRMQMQHQLDREKTWAELQADREKHMQEMEFEREKHGMEMQMKREEFNAKLETDYALQSAKQSSDAELKGKEIEARSEPKVTIDGKEQIGQVAEEMRGMAQTNNEQMAQAMNNMSEGIAALAQAMGEFKQIAKSLAAPKRVVRGADGRAVGVETVQ